MALPLLPACEVWIVLVDEKDADGLKDHKMLHKQFASREEMKAYLQGVQAGLGWWDVAQFNSREEADLFVEELPQDESDDDEESEG